MGSRVFGVASSASSVTICEAHSQREMLSLHNASTAILYLNYTDAASIASGGYFVAIPAGGHYEVPVKARGAAKEKITGIWSAANGFVNVCEYTP